MKRGSPLQQLLGKAYHRTFIKNKDLQICLSPAVNSTTSLRTLKAVYPHFTQVKRKGGLSGNLSSVNLSTEELTFAMEEAKNAYETMQEIQDKLNHAYQELMLLRSPSN